MKKTLFEQVIISNPEEKQETASDIKEVKSGGKTEKSILNNTDSATAGRSSS